MNRKILDLEILEKNLKDYTSKKVCAMVKANAYGHGVKEIVGALKDKVDFFGVCSMREAEEVRAFCDTPVLIVTPIRDVKRCLEQNFHFVADDFDTLSKAKKLGAMHLVHIKINTGMNRFGFCADDRRVIKRLRVELKDQQIGGICTHFSTLSNKKVTKREYEKFCKVKKFLKVDALTHFGGSGVINYDFDYDMIRVGLGLYLSETHGQVMKVIGSILEVRDIDKGSVGYNGRFVVSAPVKIACVSVGYADGLVGAFSGCFVKVNGYRCKIVGSICMDVCFIDVTDVPCKEGDEVEVLSDVFEVSKKTKIIPYEIFTNFNNLRQK